MRFADGHRYEGRWRADRVRAALRRGVWFADSAPQADGSGTMTYANGNRYEGEWAGGKFHGTGVFTWASGSQYTGRRVSPGCRVLRVLTLSSSFELGRRCGHGMLVFANGAMCVMPSLSLSRPADRAPVQLRGRVPRRPVLVRLGLHRPPRVRALTAGVCCSGRGEMRYANGDLYAGAWEAGLRHGFGRLQASDGDVYEGMWVANRRCAAAGSGGVQPLTHGADTVAGCCC
jgi:hypothetical protein